MTSQAPLGPRRAPTSPRLLEAPGSYIRERPARGDWDVARDRARKWDFV